MCPTSYLILGKYKAHGFPLFDVSIQKGVLEIKEHPASWMYDATFFIHVARWSRGEIEIVLYQSKPRLVWLSLSLAIVNIC